MNLDFCAVHLPFIRPQSCSSSSNIQLNGTGTGSVYRWSESPRGCLSGWAACLDRNGCVRFVTWIRDGTYIICSCSSAVERVQVSRMNVFHRLCFKVKSAIHWREDFVLGKETSLSIRRSRFFYPFLCLSCNFENVAVQSSIILIIMGTLVPSPCCNLLSLYRNTLNYIIPSLPLLFFASSHLYRFSLNHSSVITHSSVVSPWLVSVAPIPEINYILICIQRWSFAAKHSVGRKSWYHCRIPTSVRLFAEDDSLNLPPPPNSIHRPDVQIRVYKLIDWERHDDVCLKITCGCWF